MSNVYFTQIIAHNYTHFALKSWSVCLITDIYFTPIIHNHTHTFCVEIVTSMSSVHFTQIVAYNDTHRRHTVETVQAHKKKYYWLTIKKIKNYWLEYKILSLTTLPVCWYGSP